MKISLLAAGIALGMMAFAPAASAQASCADIERLLDEASTEFDDIYGEEIDFDLYETDLILPAATECSVDFTWDAIYFCIWDFKDEASATRFAAAQTQTLRACLAKDAWKEVTFPPEENDTWKSFGRTTFTDVEYEATVFELRTDGMKSVPGHYEVSLSLAVIY